MSDPGRPHASGSIKSSIALISDIHANVHALEAVLTHAAANGAEEIWNLGDSVGYGGFPDEVIQLLNQDRFLNIKGNYDEKVLKFPKKTAKWQKSKHPLKHAAFEFAYHRLSPDSKTILASWPDARTLQHPNHLVLLVHGSPHSNTEGIGSSMTEDHLRTLAQTCGVDLICGGHTHRPFLCRVSGVSFLNPGSVGRPDDGDPRASYAMIELTCDEPAIMLHRVTYDLDRAAHEMLQRGLPDVFVQMFREGRDLNFILASNT